MSSNSFIPINWKIVKLRDILKVSQGLQITISNRFLEPADNRVPYITIPYIEGKKREFIEDANQSVLCKKNDLLVVRTGSGVGKIMRGVQGAFHNNFFKIKTFDNLSTNYLYFFLTSTRTQFLMRTYAGNSTIPDLNHGDFYSLNFLLPPLKEQQKIAEILTILDDSILKQNELIKFKEKHKKGLMQKLLTGKVRFSEFSDDWSSEKLGKLCTIKKGTQLNKLELTEEGDYPAINGGIEPSGYTDDWNTEKNTITISEGGNSCGYINFITSKFWSGGHCYSLLDLKINKVFLYQYLKLSEMKIMRLRVGSGLPNIQKKDIENFKVSMPSSDEQDKIAEILGFADEEIYLLENELQEIKEQKKGLMQKLLTGEVRVNI